MQLQPMEPVPGPSGPRTDAVSRLQGRSAHAVLWIDDEIRPTDAVVAMLRSYGLRVDCAHTGQIGLAKADTNDYDGIILDVRLPDISGIDVLRRLTARNRTTPVLMLTGYPDLELAVQAMRLGAWDYKPKTVLLDDDWVALIGDLVRRGQHKDGEPASRTNPADTPAGWLDTLVDVLERTEGSSEIDRNHLLSVLAMSIGERTLSLSGFLECARALREIVSGAGNVPLDFLAGRVRRALAPSPLGNEWASPRVRSVLDALERGMQEHARRSEADVARELGVHPTRLGRRLRAETGLTFGEWRRALAVRAIAVRLRETDELVSQIAYAVGFDHPNQAARDVRAMFGLSPLRYRQLCRQSIARLND